jgi:diguanylate cyclase (GGDEF)-like protein
VQNHSTLTAQANASTAPRPGILVIDDQRLDLELIGDILGADYEVYFATDGVTALELAASKLPDLIMLDVMMPGIDGYEVYGRLKADRRTSDIPVMFITGLGDVSAETRGLELGAVDYITKPINPEPLKARVNTQVRLKLTRDKLARMASTDGLTGLANRSYFDAMLAYEIARHTRSGGELSLILLDIDHFKSYNDTYGHVQGDECLRTIAQAIQRVAVRATDIVARYGGEEFVLLLPETHLVGALVLAERVRKSISDIAIPHSGSRRRHVTASLGVASVQLAPGSPRVDLVQEADIQLYAAKAGGRNRVASKMGVNSDGAPA